jgi:hypothetical protein
LSFQENDGEHDIDDAMAAAKRQLEVVPGNMEPGVRGQNKVSDLAERLFVNPPEYRKVELPESKGKVTNVSYMYGLTIEALESFVRDIEQG